MMVPRSSMEIHLRSDRVSWHLMIGIAIVAGSSFMTCHDRSWIECEDCPYVEFRDIWWLLLCQKLKKTWYSMNAPIVWRFCPDPDSWILIEFRDSRGMAIVPWSSSVTSEDCHVIRAMAIVPWSNSVESRWLRFWFSSFILCHDCS